MRLAVLDLERAGEIVALQLVATVPQEERELRFGLDPLGHHSQPHAVGKVDDGDGERGVVRVAHDVPDERAVDLEHVEGKPLQVGEAGVAGPEIIHGEVHAERFQLVQHLHRLLRVAHQQRLRELQLQVPGRDRALGEYAAHRGDEILVLKLAGRQVDRDRARAQAGIHPGP
jgi:hypothetical protein